MPPLLKAIAAILLAGAVSGCGLWHPQVACESPPTDPAPLLTCDMAVEAATDFLGFGSGVERLEVRYGGFCPPSARCGEVSDLTSARVIGSRSNGDDIVLIVTLRDDEEAVVNEVLRFPTPSAVPAG